MKVLIFIILSITVSSCTHITYSSDSYMNMVKDMCSFGVKSYSPDTGRVNCYDNVID